MKDTIVIDGKNSPKLSSEQWTLLQENTTALADSLGIEIIISNFHIDGKKPFIKTLNYPNFFYE